MKKSILIVISSLKIWWWAEKIACWLWKLLFEKEYNVHFLTFYNFKKLYEFKGENYCLNEDHSNSLFIKFFKLFIRAYKINKLCRNSNISTSISFMEESNFSNILSKLLFWNKAKIIVSSRYNSLKKIFLLRIWIKILYNTADYIVSVSKKEKYYLSKYFWINTNKIKVIYNFVEKDKINELKLEDLWEHCIYYREKKL